MNKRTYNQFCPLAYSLDVIGDRWTLLIVRELMFGPRRYTDLQQGLPGIGTNLLAKRLKDMEAADIISQREGGALTAPLRERCAEQCKKSTDEKCTRACHELLARKFVPTLKVTKEGRATLKVGATNADDEQRVSVLYVKDQDGIRVAGTMLDKAEAPKFVFDVEHGTTKLTPYAIGPDEAVWRGSEVKMSKPTLWHLERRAEEEREAKEEM